MPARHGEEYIAGLKGDQEVWLGGERVADVTTHPGLKRGISTLASLYDLQWDPQHHKMMTYPSPTTGDPVGLSFIQPRSHEDITARSAMMKAWAEATLGMMGRSPDFLNVAIAIFAANHQFFAELEPRFGENIVRYYEHIRENDLCLTHSLINMRVDRSRDGTSLEEENVALRKVGQNSDGIVVRGARMLATLAPASDDIAVYPYAPLPERDDSYALAFSIPCSTPGLKFICRDSFDYGDSHFDAPISSRFEEMDCVAIFDDVLVPWERVFSHGNAKHYNTIRTRTGFGAHVGLHISMKGLAKSEFVLGVAHLITEALGSGQALHVQERLGELVTYTETIRACIMASEAGAAPGPGGIWYPAPEPLNCVRTLFPKWYPRMIELLQLLGSGSFMVTPSEAGLSSPIAPLIERYYRGVDVTAKERIRLFRLAWDLVGSSMGSRQELYERYFSGDPMRNMANRYLDYDISKSVAMARRLMSDD